MVEYYGWLRLWQSVDGEGEDGIWETRKKVEKLLKEIEVPRRLILFGVTNAAHILQVSGRTNHYTQEVEDIIDLFRSIGEIAVGSHGLLYIHNDEDPKYYNEFRVWRLARGKLEELQDVLLSPCNPTIEE